MPDEEKEEKARLLARANDLLARARAGEITACGYLTPAQLHFLTGRLQGAAREWEADGGYEAAERKRIFFLPEYVSDAEEPLRGELLAEIKAERLCPVHICGSGFRELAHRDYLGAVLSLGVRRDALGDLCVIDPHSAVLFADRVLYAFFLENLTRVANDAVRISLYDLPPGFDGGRRFLSCTDTVASPRADAVVAAICNLSREKAQALFREGRVEISYEVTEKHDRTVEAGEILVIRGYGKYRVRALSDKTKKGRFRLEYDRFL